MDIIQKTLAQIGLSPKEIQVYLMCLRLGPQPASNIARRTKISRATVYDLLKDLIKKGLAYKHSQGAKTVFEVLDPDHLLEHLEREKEQFISEKDREKLAVSEILPLLRSIEIEKSERVRVQFFEGEAGLRKAYGRTLETEGPIRAYANIASIDAHFPDFFTPYAQKRAFADILIRAIMPDNEACRARQKLDDVEKRETRLIPESEYTFSPEINIFDDKVLYTSWKEKMAVLIESQEIAEFHRSMFDLLWGRLSTGG